MRQRNHCSSLKGIPKMKLQDSGPSGPKSLQSQNRPRPENRLSISRLDVVHGQLFNFEIRESTLPKIRRRGTASYPQIVPRRSWRALQLNINSLAAERVSAFILLRDSPGWLPFVA